MLVPFAIDCGALTRADGTDKERYALHRRLIDRWMEFGLLIFAGDRRDQSTIARTVETLPQDLRTLWKTALKTGRTWPGPEGWVGLESVASPADLRSIEGSVRLACLERDRYHIAFNIDEKEGDMTFQLRDPAMEIARYDFADQALCFREAKILGAQDIESDISVLDLWNRRIRSTALYSSNVVIVDQYGLKDGDSLDGLENFLIHLDRAARRCKVEIYCSYGYDAEGYRENPSNLANKLATIRRKLTNSGVPAAEIHLNLIHFGDFRLEAHDRYVRFDSHVFQIGTGIEVFYPGSTGLVPRKTSWTFKRRGEFHNNIEAHLRSRAHPLGPWRR